MSSDISIFEPKPYQVIQREGFNPRFAHANNPSGPSLGKGVVRVSGSVRGISRGRYEARTVPLREAFGKAVDWQRVNVHLDGESFWTEVEVPAGGWYRLGFRVVDGEKVIQDASVEPIGVGEVFIIAGQSYAANANDAITTIEDPQGRVTAYDPASETWRVADDPQPTILLGMGERGSIWPATMNLLLPLVRVPIGMVNVAVGGTSSRQWMPGEELFKNFVNAGLWAGNFRYVLWQQGESDVIERTSVDVYKDRIITIKKTLEDSWGFSRPWILAKSTLHPIVYNIPEREGWIRQAIDDLWHTPGFLPGPDTDILGGVGIHRASKSEGGSGHFTLLGQKRAGLMWFSAIWNHLNNL